MATTDALIDEACPECGFDGPHSLFPAETPDEPTMAECGDSECGAEWRHAEPVQPASPTPAPAEPEPAAAEPEPEPMCSVTELHGGCGPLELEALRALDREMYGGDVPRARVAELLVHIADARQTEGRPLPQWAELSDLDKGCALLYLHKADYEGGDYARVHYPAKFLDNPLLASLPPGGACDYAEVFEEAALELHDAEHARLYDAALAATTRPGA